MPSHPDRVRRHNDPDTVRHGRLPDTVNDTDMGDHDAAWRGIDGRHTEPRRVAVAIRLTANAGPIEPRRDTGSVVTSRR
jgi:hypothetical protein